MKRKLLTILLLTTAPAMAETLPNCTTLIDKGGYFAYVRGCDEQPSTGDDIGLTPIREVEEEPDPCGEGSRCVDPDPIDPVDPDPIDPPSDPDPVDPPTDPVDPPADPDPVDPPSDPDPSPPGDGNNGHGNDPGNTDQSNPGQGGGGHGAGHGKPKDGH